jgi:hypothetical protein
MILRLPSPEASGTAAMFSPKTYFDALLVRAVFAADEPSSPPAATIEVMGEVTLYSLQPFARFRAKQMHSQAVALSLSS